MWQVSFNNKLQSSLGRLNLGSRVAKIKSSEKKTNKGKANKKGDDQKLYNAAKRYWMAWSVKHKKKRDCMSACLEERSKYFTFSEIQISPKEEMEVSSLFLIIKAKLPARAKKGI